MHELSLAMETIRTVQSVMEREKAGELVSIRVEIGALSGVEKDSFEFCFPIAAQGTPAVGAKLVIDEVPVLVQCASCGNKTQPEPLSILCGDCGSPNVQILAGRDFVIKSLEVR